MFLETGAQNLDRLVELTLPAEVLAELEEDPGGRILPEFESQLLETIVHEIYSRRPWWAGGHYF
jgi:hypothetical protein